MSIQAVQEANINYEVYADGDRALGSASVDLPDIDFITEEISGAGIAGKIDVGILGHIENLETTIHWRTIFEKPLYLMKQRTVMLSLRGAMQRYNAATGVRRAVPVRIDLRVAPTSLKLGSLEPAAQTDTESTFTADYIKVTENNSVVFEHDKFNYIFVVDGVDILAEVRDALGL